MVVRQPHGQFTGTNMMHGKINYTAPNRLPIPIGDRSGAKAIAHWLGNDIQYSIASVDRWLTTFLGIAEGAVSKGYQGTGNAFSVFATGSTVLLESEHVESHKVCLNVEQVSAALEQYRMFLTSDYKSPGFQPTPFEVEFLAEEGQATECYLEHGGVMA
jgi:hypothetical protein